MGSWLSYLYGEPISRIYIGGVTERGIQGGSLRRSSGEQDRMLKILVAGGFDERNPDEEKQFRAFSAALGAGVVRHGHVLLSGCKTTFDAMVAEAAHRSVLETHESVPTNRIISYALSGQEPVHAFGTILRSRLANWDIGGEARLYIPETIQQADVVVLAGGFDGTYRAANWARIANKPLLPLASLGGAAAKIYDQELSDFDRKYSGLLERIEFEQLNSIKSDWTEHALDILALAQKVAGSRHVLVIMSYSPRPDLKDAYATFCRVTEAEDMGFKCRRVTEKNACDRILPEVLDRIERSAFVIVDLTDLRPNVFYELGYADGLGKRVIVTAKKGTELPFDVKDIPTIFWESYEDLAVDLRSRIIEVVKPAVVIAAPPIGPG